MSCPTCDHTMQSVASVPEELNVYHCPRCGTVKVEDSNDTQGRVYVPTRNEDYQRLVRKVAHGCTDANCDDCDPAPVKATARDLWLPNLGRDHPNASEEEE